MSGRTQPVGTYQAAHYYRVVMDEAQMTAVYAAIGKSVQAHIHGSGPRIDKDHKAVPGQYYVAFTIPADDPDSVDAARRLFAHLKIRVWR